ncbi:membrane protein DedA with SNARE-associated domain [Kitasatospora sp. MAA19]|uniref:DedA family protein n=1 Tax=unclassified Kitasatospora TaxID=2633591 RepID=UPI00247529BA|nr:DedA family protein [Kitasatospora sp. MAA19]MDH6708461.1 membrane protein DedA with SNARE-associated domain [Kitasatospora sp. MAA19]
MSAPTTPLPGALAGLAPLLDHYGYLAVALLVLLDNCGIPVPGQTILVLASVYAGTGHLDFAAVVLIAFAAAALGNSLGYLIGHTGGRAFVHRWGRYVLLTPARMERADGFFARHGGEVVTVARFVDGLRQANGIIAGTTEMPWRRFQPFNLLGAALWTGVWATFGYLAGANIGTVYRTAIRYQLWFAVGLGLVVAALLLRQVLRYRRRSRTDPGSDAGSDADAGSSSGSGTDAESDPDPDAR